MFGPGGQRLDALEEQAYHILVEQAVAVLAEGRVVPYRLIHRETDEPTKQQVEIDLLNQLPRGTDGVDHLEQRRAAAAPVLSRPSPGGSRDRRNPGPSTPGQYRPTRAGDAAVIVRDTPFERGVAEQLILF